MAKKRKKVQTGRKITFCTEPHGDVIEQINVWHDLDNRGRRPPKRGVRLRTPSPIVDKVKHGETGTLLKREGDKCTVRTARGKKGQVTFYFIKELKGEWLEERRATLSN